MTRAISQRSLPQLPRNDRRSTCPHRPPTVPLGTISNEGDCSCRLPPWTAADDHHRDLCARHAAAGARALKARAPARSFGWWPTGSCSCEPSSSAVSRRESTPAPLAPPGEKGFYHFLKGLVRNSPLHFKFSISDNPFLFFISFSGVLYFFAYNSLDYFFDFPQFRLALRILALPASVWLLHLPSPT